MRPGPPPTWLGCAAAAHAASVCLPPCLTVTGAPAHSWQVFAWTASSRPWCSNGAINGEAFLAYIEQFLAPTLAAGDIVIVIILSVVLPVVLPI